MADVKTVPRRVLRSKDFMAGIFFLAFGGACFLLGRGYSMGTARSMGPGYFPTLLSVALMAIGAALAARSALAARKKGQVSGPDEAVEMPAFGKLAAVSAGVAVFGFALRPLGLAPAILAMVLIVAPLSRRFKWKSGLLLAAGLAAGSSLVFVVLLGLPLPIFGEVFAALPGGR